jgi:hypothetical protein
LEGYIIEFSIENHQYFSKEESLFKEGSHGIFLQEIPLWIKILLVEERMFLIPSIEMAA